MWPFKYPYTNFHELNLDWILETTKSNTERIAANELKIKLIGGDDPLNSLHPVGSIYMSTENKSPADLFGGTWEQLKDRFLLGAGDNYVAGATGGEAQHAITVPEMPPHNHYINGNSPGAAAAGTDYLNISGTSADNTNWGANTTVAGGGQPMKIMPPYLTVYMWRRIN